MRLAARLIATAITVEDPVREKRDSMNERRLTLFLFK